MECHPFASCSCRNEAKRAINNSISVAPSELKIKIARCHGYAVVTKKTYDKKSKTAKEIIRVDFVCDRHGERKISKKRPVAGASPNASTRRGGCPMMVILMRDKSNNSTSWPREDSQSLSKLTTVVTFDA